MKIVARVLFLLLCVGGVVFGVLRERHQVHSLSDEKSEQISGAAFVSGATVDSYMLRESQLFDIYSLSKTSASQKDCKT